MSTAILLIIVVGYASYIIYKQIKNNGSCDHCGTGTCAVKKENSPKTSKAQTL